MLHPVWAPPLLVPEGTVSRLVADRPCSCESCSSSIKTGCCHLSMTVHSGESQGGCGLLGVLWFSILDELGSTLSAYRYSPPDVDEALCQTPWSL